MERGEGREIRRLVAVSIVKRTTETRMTTSVEVGAVARKLEGLSKPCRRSLLPHHYVRVLSSCLLTTPMPGNFMV